MNGRSGIGKTQLLRAVTDLIPYTGQLLLDGVSISSFSAPIWRSRVSHDPEQLQRLSDRVLCMEKNRLMEKTV